MRSTLLLSVAASFLLCCLLPVAAQTTTTEGAATTDCRLASVLISTKAGVTSNVVYTPTFDKDVKDGYKLTVPADVTKIYLTPTAYAPGEGVYMAFGAAAGSAKLKQVGVSKFDGEQSGALPLQPGVNTIVVTETCDCRATYYFTITRATITYTKGDPLFAGLLGQQFQVHGVAGEVYNIISDPAMQMNSKFVFLNHGECPILHGKKANACWSHPGSYLGEIGIKTCSGERLLLKSGSAKHGFQTAELDGRPLERGEVIPLHCNKRNNNTDGEEAFVNEAFVTRNSTHLVTVQLSNFLLQIENSDMFVNYRVKVLDWAALEGTHGLLGQTYKQPEKPSKQIKEIEGNVDDYVVQGKDLFGDEWAFNQFSLSDNNASEEQ